MEHDASKHLVYLSGELLPPDQAKISVFDTAVTLGDTVTESTRTFGHRPFKLDGHIERLYKSLKVSRINAGLSPEEMTAITLAQLPLFLLAVGGTNGQVMTVHVVVDDSIGTDLEEAYIDSLVIRLA